MDIHARLRELQEFDSALLANTLHYVDPTPPEQLYMGGSIRCLTTGIGPMVGVAVTCQIDSSSPGGTANMMLFYQQLEAIQKMDVPVVWVAQAVGSRPDHECVLGDGMAKLLRSAGCIGAVTNGGIRDVAGYASVPFHAFARGTVIHHTQYGFRTINEPVEVGGLTIHPGDLIHGSAEGVIKLPEGSLSELAARAVKMRAFEQEAHFVFRDPQLHPQVKLAKVKELLSRYGFT